MSLMALCTTPICSDDSIIVQVQDTTNDGAGFDVTAPGLHDFTITLQAIGTGNEIVWSSAFDPSGWIIWSPGYIGTQAFQHSYTAFGLTANDVHSGQFNGQLVLGGYPMMGGWFTVTTSHLDLDASDNDPYVCQMTGCPCADDDDEAITGVGVPITRPGTTTLPATLPLGETGHPLWLNVSNNSQPGMLTITVNGSGAAVYRLDNSTGEYAKVTAPIPVDEFGFYETLELHTNDNFTAAVTIEARFDHTYGLTDAADLVKVFFEPPQPIVDLDIDSNNDGTIAATNEETEDEYEDMVPKVIPIQKKAFINMNCTVTCGTVTLDCTLPQGVLETIAPGSGLVTPFPFTWDLDAGQTVQSSMQLLALGVDDWVGNPPLPPPLGSGNVTRSGTITLTHTAPDGTMTSDSVQVMITLPVSKSPQNNHAVAWEPASAFHLEVNTAVSHTDVLGYSWTRYWDDDSHYGWPGLLDLDDPTDLINERVGWTKYQGLGKKGFLVLATHGATSPQLGSMIVAKKTKDEVLNFVGLQPGQEAMLPADLFIKEVSPTFFVLAATPNWYKTNWKSDRNSARSIGLLAFCFSDGFLNDIGGAEAFGYEGGCSQNDHVADFGMLLGRMDGSLGGVQSRAAGPAFDVGGYTANFRRGANGKYWTTLCPAPFAIFDASALSSTGNLVGFGGFALDTEKDNMIAPNQVITITDGTGAFSSGPYNIQPAWGLGFQFKLEPGQSISVLGDHTKIVGDGSTDKVFMDSDGMSPNDTDINWMFAN